MLWFDYVYYRTYELYKKKWKESMPWLYAMSVVSATQSFILLSMPIIYGIITRTKLEEYGINKYHFGILAFIIVGLNYHRYKKKIPYYSMFDKWKNESESVRRSRGRLVVLYVVLTTIVFFGFAVIAGMINNDQL